MCESLLWIAECSSNVRWCYGNDNAKDNKNRFWGIATSVMRPKTLIDEKNEFREWNGK